MPPLILKWHNFSLAIRIKLSADAVYVIAISVAILYAVLSNWVKPMADNFLAGEGAIWAISATILNNKNTSNKLDVEAAKANVGKNLNAIKQASAGQAAREDPGAGATP
ncbi:MAG: hypothetical protein IMZ50_06550 [Candidatus Atribacteria bacterium]|nr:hypothetical protein [Candidatus Atribacteria bacterium]